MVVWSVSTIGARSGRRSGRTSLGVKRPFFSGSLNLNGPSRVIVRVK